MALVAVTLPMAFDRSMFFVFLYGVSVAFLQGFFDTPLFNVQLKILDRTPFLNYRRSDALVLREIFVNAGRVGGFLFLALGAHSVGSVGVSVLFGILAFMPLTAWRVIRPFNR